MQITHDPAKQRFTLELPSGTAFTAYRPAEAGVLEFYSTYVPPEERGRNVASRLVAAAMDHVRSEGLKVIPSCWYVAGWLERHPECRELLTA